MPQISSGGKRKYTDIWNLVKRLGKCEIKCSRVDTYTVMNGVKKEKLEDRNKPKKKILLCEPTDEGIMFRLVEDTSINNL